MSRLEFYYQYFISDPLGFLIFMLYMAATVLLSLILHEISHGYMALRCGDPTAKWSGRLSLNPAKHLEPVGTICMLIFGIGWAKPVPVNPKNFRHGRRDDFLVSIAGIMMNLTLFIVCVALSVAINPLLWDSTMVARYVGGTCMQKAFLNPSWNVAYAIMYGTTPDGWSVWTELMRYPWLRYVQRFLLLMAQINLSLAVFNLLPIPPLDGYHLVNDTILGGRLRLNRNTFMIMQGIVIILCLTGALNSVLSTVNTAVYDAVLNVFLKIAGGA